jgi:hypothetical protein
MSLRALCCLLALTGPMDGLLAQAAGTALTQGPGRSALATDAQTGVEIKFGLQVH